jgi:hypothetical protein
MRQKAVLSEMNYQEKRHNILLQNSEMTDLTPRNAMLTTKFA